MSGSVSMVDGHIDPDTNKLTDKEIIKALECCMVDELKKYTCDECPYKPCGCSYALCKDALDLINRQQAELERLTINMNAFGLGMKREKERADTIRAEAIKEFAEKLKEDLGIWSFDFTYYADRAEARGYIDNLVKEMVGEDK